MRDLTKEELSLTPEWATHYYIYNDGDILFECNMMYQYYDAKKKEFHDPSDCLNVSCDSALIIRKPFDIAQHEFSDADVALHHCEFGELVLNVNFSCAVLCKQDAIAIAKALGVTGEDLL